MNLTMWYDTEHNKTIYKLELDDDDIMRANLSEQDHKFLNLKADTASVELAKLALIARRVEQHSINRSEIIHPTPKQ